MATEEHTHPDRRPTMRPMRRILVRELRSSQPVKRRRNNFLLFPPIARVLLVRENVRHTRAHRLLRERDTTRDLNLAPQATAAILAIDT